MSNILVVDDEHDIRESLRGILEEEGYHVLLAESGEAGLEQLKKKNCELVLLDIWLKGMDGLDVLERIKQIENGPEVIMISGHGTIETALDAHRLRRENAEFKKQVQARSVIVGESIPIKALRQQISVMAPTNGRVLIYGESGTGKELVALAIHAQSLRKDSLFVEVNCAAIPEDWIESELFGHRKGALPGAAGDKEGKFEKADGGTLFLDEVGDMSLKTQSKVLRALDEQRFTRVGDDEPTTVDVRVIAATNKDLEEEISKGNFREDLFYRLNVIPFYVPPLRERIEDVPLLADHFLKEFTTAYGRKAKELTPEAYRVLQEYTWPGNVRELRNLMERIVIMSPQVRVDARHIPLIPGKRAVFERAAERLGSLHEVRAAAEREYILKTLDETKGNVTKTAELLGLERSNLYRKMKTLGIAPKE